LPPAAGKVAAHELDIDEAAPFERRTCVSGTDHALPNCFPVFIELERGQIQRVRLRHKPVSSRTM